MYAFALDAQQIQGLQSWQQHGLDRIVISCYSHTLGRASSFIGNAELGISSELVRGALQQASGNTGTVYLMDSSWAQEVMMPDNSGSLRRARLFLRVCVSGADFLNHRSAWVPPPLKEMMKCVDEEQIGSETNANRIGLERGGSLTAAESASRTSSVNRIVSATDDASSVSSRSSMSGSEAGGNTDSRGRQIGDEVHWRERLEAVMDSAWTSAVVIALVVVDIVIAVLFDLTAREGNSMPLEITVIQAVILGGFITELFLRYVAKRQRFWWSRWNILDLLVIAGSAIIFIIMASIARRDDQAMYASTQNDLSSSKTATTSLRVASRVAIALRMMRIVLNMRKAQRFAQGTVRSLVSQNKRRYRKHGFDLDLTYVSDRIIAMSAPAFGGHSAYRNDMHVVGQFLAARHYSRFFVFNLCDTYFSSDGALGNYSLELLFGHCHRIPFEDHSPPLLAELLHFCHQSSRWCRRHRKNVVVVHCKGGKGRTGVMVAAFLLWTGHRRCAQDALELFSFRRTENFDAANGMEGDDDDEERTRTRLGARARQLVSPSSWAGKKRTCNQGVDGPSQIRYVLYLEAVLHHRVDPYAQVVLRLQHLSLTVGSVQHRRPWHCSLRLSCCRSVVFDSLHRCSYRDRPEKSSSSTHANARTHKSGSSSLFKYGGAVGSEFVVPVGCDVWGDVRIEVYHHRTDQPSAKRKLRMFCVFNTLFCQVNARTHARTHARTRGMII